MNSTYKENRIQSRTEILEYIKYYISIHGYAPTTREIVKGTKKNADTVCCAMERLQELGEIETDEPKNSSRAYRVKGMKVVFE